VKCKEKRDFDGEIKVSDSGRRMAQGLCPVCGEPLNDAPEGGHDHEPKVDSRWAALDALRTQSDARPPER